MEHNLKHKAVKGIRWNTLGSLLTSSVQLVQLICVARWLAPEDFGQMAMVTVVTSIGQLFGQRFLLEGMVQCRDFDNTRFVSCLVFQSALGGATAIIIWLLATPVSQFFGSPAIIPLLKTVAAIFLFSGLATPFHALLVRELKNFELVTSQISGSLVQVTVAISLAWYGLGVWALLYAFMAQLLVTRGLFIVFAVVQADTPFTWKISWSSLTDLLRFSLYRLGAQGIGIVFRRLDRILIGAMLGETALGYYSFAHNLIFQFIDNLVPVFNQVGLPLLSQVKQTEKERRGIYMQLVVAVAAVMAPVLFGFSATAPVAVKLIFGEQWDAAVPLVQILSVAGLFVSLSRVNTVLANACGKADRLFRWKLATLPGLLLALGIGAWSGQLVWMAITLSTYQLILVPAEFHFLVRSLCGGRLAIFLRHLRGPVVAALGMSISVTTLPLWLKLPPALLLVTQVASGALLYGAVVLLLLPHERAMLAKFLALPSLQTH